MKDPCPNITDVHRVTIKEESAIPAANFIATGYPYARPMLIV